MHGSFCVMKRIRNSVSFGFISFCLLALALLVPDIVSATSYITGNTLSTTTAFPGQTITFNFQINNPNSFNVSTTLGAQIRPSGTSNWIDNYSNDKNIILPPGTSSSPGSIRYPQMEMSQIQLNLAAMTSAG